MSISQWDEETLSYVNIEWEAILKLWKLLYFNFIVIICYFVDP